MLCFFCAPQHLMVPLGLPSCSAWLQVQLHSGAEQQQAPGDTLHYVESSTMLGRVCRCMDEAASRDHQAGEVPCSRGTGLNRCLPVACMVSTAGWKLGLGPALCTVTQNRTAAAAGSCVTSSSAPQAAKRQPLCGNAAEPEATSVAVQGLMPPGTLRQELWRSLCTALHILSPPGLLFATSR